MALKVSATMTFTGYVVRDDGIQLNFSCATPGAGEPTDYAILLTDSDLAAITTQAQLSTAVRTKLERKFRLSGIASKLDPFIGQSLVI